MGWSRTILEWTRTNGIKRRKQSKMGILLELYFDQKQMVGKLKQLTPIDSTQIQIFDTHLTQKWCIILGVSILVHSIKFMWMKRHETLIFDQLSTCWHNLFHGSITTKYYSTCSCNNTCSNGNTTWKCSKNVTTILLWWWWSNFTSSSIDKSLHD
jgi:hypothetical protein